MDQKKAILVALGAILVGSGFFVFKQSTIQKSSDSLAIAENISKTVISSKGIKDLIDPRYKMADTDTGNWSTYRSPSDFEVKIPEGTKVQVLQERKYTITRFTFPKTKHVLDIESYEGDVNQSNLNGVIAEGKYWILADKNRFADDRQFKCGDDKLCFLEQLHADKTSADENPPLAMVHVSVFSKDSHPFFYQFNIGDYSAPLTQDEVSFLAAMLGSFSLTNKQ